MRNIPSFVETICILFRGYLPRVFKARGWVLAFIIMVPFVIVHIFVILGVVPNPARLALELYHNGYASVVIPVIALVSASACISEDIEQRTLPLMLVRPAPAWALPIGKGLLWFSWCSTWLLIVVTLMQLVGMEVTTIPRKIIALVFTLWAQLGLVSLLGLIFKRGILWAGIVLFLWDPLVTLLPGTMQRLTFSHYLQSLAGGQYSINNMNSLLAQAQISTPFWLAATVLIAVGALAWALCGIKVMNMQIGLSGRESEG
ncbi:MAG: hypothetical protein FWG02_08190 [Holophagaceae bacterium]|nr:hypothetical protein [Holophagaceae bacterium]